MISELIKRVPIDINLPTDVTDDKGKGKSVDDEMDEDEDGKEDAVAKAWSEWEDKIMKIITVCKDYGLDEVMVSVCRVGFTQMFSPNTTRLI